MPSRFLGAIQYPIWMEKKRTKRYKISAHRLCQFLDMSSQSIAPKQIFFFILDLHLLLISFDLCDFCSFLLFFGVVNSVLNQRYQSWLLYYHHWLLISVPSVPYVPSHFLINSMDDVWTKLELIFSLLFLFSLFNMGLEWICSYFYHVYAGLTQSIDSISVAVAATTAIYIGHWRPQQSLYRLQQWQTPKHNNINWQQREWCESETDKTKMFFAFEKQ